MRDISYKVALGGIVSALCLVTMFLAGILPALYLLLPMIAGVLLMIIAAEVSTGWALLTYVSVSLLSLFVTFDKEVCTCVYNGFRSLSDNSPVPAKTAVQADDTRGKTCDFQRLCNSLFLCNSIYFRT